MGGCSITRVATQGFSEIPDGARVAVVRPGITYYRVTVGGVPEPAPDWTESARQRFDAALVDYVAEHNMACSSPKEEDISDQLLEFTRLHSAVQVAFAPLLVVAWRLVCARASILPAGRRLNDMAPTSAHSSC